MDGAPDRRGQRFRDDIQGLRAVAVLVVVVFHTGVAMTGGFVGVDVFFVISGFVIGSSLVAEHGRTGTIAAGAFYLRRIRRLLPALALLLVAVAFLAPWFGPRNDAVTERMVEGGSLFGANVSLLLLQQGYFDPAAEWNPLLHLWTLSLEEQVYLVIPALLLAVGAIVRRRPRSWARTVAAVYLAGAVASFAAALLLAGGVVQRFGPKVAEGAFYLAPTRIWEFLAGALLALGGSRLARLGGATRQVAGAIGTAVLAWAVVGFDAGTRFPQVAATVPVVAAVLLVVAGTGAGSAVSRGLSVAPLRWIGDRSYSWYLWHWPAIVFARATFPASTWAPVAAGLASLVPAAVAHRLVEEPIRRHRPASAGPTLALGLACIVVPLLVAQTVVPVGRRLDRDPAMASIGSAAAPHVDQVRRCNDSLADPQGHDACTWPVEGRERVGRALLLGDSNAGHLSEGFILAAHGLGLDATIQTRAACPASEVVVRRNGFVDTSCARFAEAQAAWIRAERPSVVVVAQAGDLLMDKPQVELGRTADGPFRADDDGQGDVWAEGTSALLADLGDAGIPVVLVAPVPRFTGWPGLGGCARVVVRSDEQGCDATREPETRVVDRAEAAALAAVPSAVGVDLAPVLCPDGTCRTRRDGVWLWKDESHLSVAGAEAMAPHLQDAVDRALSGP